MLFPGRYATNVAAMGGGGGVPVNTVPPALDNTSPTVGDTITCSTGTWTGSPSSYAYQWYANGAPIGEETNNAHTVTSGDGGVVLSCMVSATNVSGTSDPVSSNSSDAVTFAPVNSVAPVIVSNSDLNNPHPGDTLTVSSDGTWSGVPAPTFTYAWITGAFPNGGTASAYVIDPAEVGSVIFCRVTGTNTVAAVSADSNTSGTVTEP